MVYAQTRIHPEEISVIFRYSQKTRPRDSKPKKNAYILADHRVKIKENEKRYCLSFHLDLSRELKKLWNMLVMVILIVISALETIPKKGLLELETRE